MSYTAAAMYGGAAFVGLVEAFIPGSPSFSIVPGVVALAIVTVLLGAGRRMPRWAMALLGPIGVGLIGYAVATSAGPGDGAVLYVWPVLWTAYFYGRRGAIWIVGCVAVAHGVALLALSAPDAYFDRWIDVMVSMSVVAVVVQMLARRNNHLLARVTAEARTDTLTGVFNRRGFDEHAGALLAHARRARESLAIASLDLDYFKRINDQWGHDTGDRVLARFAALLAVQSRGIDVVARIGGEEFVVLLPGCTVVDAEAFTQRIRSALLDDGDPELPAVRMSAGVAAEVAPPDLRSLLQNADAGLYAAKRSGRDRTVVFHGGATDDAGVPVSAPTPL